MGLAKQSIFLKNNIIRRVQGGTKLRTAWKTAEIKPKSRIPGQQPPENCDRDHLDGSDLGGVEMRERGGLGVGIAERG